MEFVKTLNLAGDGDECEIFEALESAFDIKFSRLDFSQAETVQHVFDILLGKVRHAFKTGKCAGAMSFYRLRRTAKREGQINQISPKTLLSNLAIKHPARWVKMMAHNSSLRLPPTHGGTLEALGFLTGLVGAINLLFMLFPPSLLGIACSVSLFAIAKLLMHFDRGKFPENIKTFGDLATATACLNIGKLTAEGAQLNAGQVWTIMSRLIGDLVGIDPEKIGRDTLILASKSLCRGS